MAPETQSKLPERKVVPRWRRFLPLLGLVLLGWVLSRLELSAMGAALSRVSLTVLVVASTSFMLNLLLKAYRWQRLLQTQGIHIPLGVALAAFLSGQFYAQVTLGRAGEFFRIEALIERGVSAGAALASCIFDRLLDVFTVLLCGSVFAALVLGNVQLALVALAIMVVGAVVASVMIEIVGAPAESRKPNFVTRLLERMSQQRLLAKLVKVFRDLAQGMRPMLRPRALVEMSLLTAIAWVGYFAALWQLAEGLGLGVSRLLLTSTASFAALSALLPVTVSGLGARELIYISVLQGQGVPNESAVVLSLLHLFVMSISATVFGFAGVLFRQRQKL